ncbi:MAG: winged helix DNA-binding domain-containing protein [Nitrososphaerota archaeon]|nr:winged helix DNA-binding domain-containing protein [Nitrososphaerota archaeon]
MRLWSIEGDEFERQAAQRAIRALGTAAPSEIVYYFVRGRYQTLKKTLATLEAEGAIHRVTVEGLGKEERYVHEQDVPLLESMGGKAWQPRTALVAPFDNLIAGRQRTNRVFGFDYVHEQFLPKEKRKFGTWVLPILRGDRLIGRVDPKLDKEKGKLVINSVHAEPGAPEEREVAADIAETIQGLASFVGAKEVEYSPRVPAPWRGALR